MPTTKTCTKCGETKPLDGFSKAKGYRYGVRATCKSCRAEHHRRYYEENRDKIEEYQRRYREENRDILNVKLYKQQRETQELTEMFATTPKRTPWIPEDVAFLLADNGMTTYEKAVKLGRTYKSCNRKLARLRKKLGVSPGDH